MATQTKTKTQAQAQTQTQTQTTPVTSAAATPTSTPTSTSKPQESKSTPTILTIIVVDDKSQRTSGAKVTVEQSGASGLTDSNGEIQFSLGNAPKYDVKVTLGKNTVTVPYYVTKDGSTRLMVNPTYVKTVEAQIARGQYGWFGSHMSLTFGGLGIIIVLVILWKLMRRKGRRR